ncbi:non-ribosomal peptide synthetase [Rhodococcus sp. 14-2470-1a]|uniref:non-ribosomal peptide synthetase n=1 Tax=Rhodococcus sp. 14-2470-1a TaxID=2023150 RepID=UPI000B9A6743|nr:non-ribosomal peptide synthetase [Rhodococcus sp. 14-2470-1a]OZF41328.1 hypothetical protein CH292_27920 [Rhodococcus sp. 14-2470-1a]OZF41355.1 hypothetical protein CH292_28065 [Rhodococcus sp. 14-2470-1a]
MRLSPGQERLWLVQQLDQTSAAYNIPIVLRFRGGIDSIALESALAQLVKRHPVLNWLYTANEVGIPCATTVPGFRIPVARRIADPGENGWRTHAADLAAEPFDLAAAPPVRAMVIECSDGSSVFCLVNHHIITDGRSIQIVTEDLIAFYGSKTPPRLDVTYADFVAWQRSVTDDDSVAQHLNYWRNELDGFEPLRLPIDQPRSATPQFASDHVDFELPIELTSKLRAFALRQRSPLSSTMAALFQALLSLHSGQEDITIGTVLAGRDDRRFADVLGFFVNTVVLRTHVTQSTTFRDLLQVARNKMVEAYAHQQAPFEQVVAQVRPNREAGRNAIFDVVVVHNGEIASADDGEITTVPWAGVATRFDLELVTHVQDGRLCGSLVFRSSLFRRSTATRLVSRLAWLIERALDHPDEPIFGSLSEQIDYWRSELANTRPALDISFNHLRPEVFPRDSASVSFDVEPFVAERLRGQESRRGIGLFTALLAGYAVVLSRYARVNKVAVGTSVTARLLPEPLVGHEVNTLVMGVDLSGDPTFSELMDRVQTTVSGAYANPDVPFERLVAELVQTREFNRGDLTQVGLQVVSTPFSEELPDSSGAGLYDLLCRMSDVDGRLEGRLDYAPELFDRVTIERFANNFRRLLSSAADNPDRSLSALPMLSDVEVRQLTIDLNDTTVPLPTPATVPSAFADQVRHRPHATALACGDASLTYAELDIRSTQFAHRLQTLGAGPGTLVGVCMPRSIDLVIALLAVLKTGAAYVPVDPEFPDERQELILGDSGALFAITADLINDPSVYSEPTIALQVAAKPDDLAYVIYTSGSTGIPKGVEIEHRSIIRLVTGLPDGVLGPSKVVLHASAISFDAAVFEVWGALLTGATCVVSTDRVLTALPLAAAIARHRVSTLWLTSSLFNHVVDEDTTALTGLRHLLVGGEALSVAHIRRAATVLGDTQLFNAYGPTECTTFVTCYPISAPLPNGINNIPIGRPIGNTRVYILDDHDQLVPIGVPGHLHVAGIGVARGYRGQPDLTAQHFATKNHDAIRDRLYATGDLVRYNENGQMEYLGRIDSQVKIRGYRIEPREIEAALHDHPDIANAAIVTRESSSGEKELVAYLQPSEKAVLNENTVRSHLRHKLPEYMVPSLYVSLLQLPLTINGKLDYKALPPATGDIRLNTAPTLAPPRNQTEETLLQIWTTVLNTDTMGRDDSFFDLGGHSLKAAQLVVQIEKSFGVLLPLRTLFERPTIAMQAREIEGGPERQTAPSRTFDPHRALHDVVPHHLPPRKRRQISNILLTGATGFVGAFLLRELLAQTNARIFCLVRADDERSGLERLCANLKRYELWHDVDQERVTVVRGDLALPGLGLSNPAFEQLASDIDLICHNGAHVDALSSYEQLEAANVGGTRELIRLASTTSSKHLQFVSTISAGDVTGPRSGYAETKLDAEELVHAANRLGVSAAIYRLPRVVGDTHSGQGNARDIMLRVLRIILELGAAPDTALEEPWIAVNDVASRLVKLATRQAIEGSRFVLTSEPPVRLTHLVDLLRHAGTYVATQPLVDWLTSLEAYSPEEHAILKVLFDAAPRDSNNILSPQTNEFTSVVVRRPDDVALLRYIDRMLVRSPQLAT